MTNSKPLPIALTISGAVALGAYEGGVLAALIAGLRPLYRGDRPRVHIDVIGGASAGSIAGLLAARCIAEGTDAFTVMREAWVVRDGLSDLMKGAKSSPLTAESLQEVAAELLRMPGDTAEQQRKSVHVTMALGALRGLEYDIKSTGFSTAPISANTFLDWKNVVVSPGQKLEDFVHAGPYRPGVDEPTLVDFALASGANAFGFPPMVVNRSGDEHEYDEHDIGNFPESKAYWYTDGGTLDNEPIGRTLDIAGGLDDQEDVLRRLLVLIHPDPPAAPTARAWADPSNPPTWVETLARAFTLQTTQSIYDDIRHAAKTNRRVEETNTLAAVLATALAELDPAAQTTLATQLAEPLKRDAPDSITADLVRDALHHAAGLTGKHEIGIEVLSPLLLPEAQGAKPVPVKDLLAGEFLHHFGGFARTALRQHDFDLGYRTVLSWFEQTNPPLAFHGLDGGADAIAADAARAAYKPPPDDGLGKTTFSKLKWAEKARFGKLFGKAAWIAYRGRFHRSHQ
jgi:predicted acylesterase/phospholipase RssA